MSENAQITVLSPETVLVADATEKYPVDARKLHAWLEVETQFRDWTARRFADYGLEENLDYCAFFERRHDSRGKQKDYRLTLSAAKELAMVERNAKGREIRKYFIACEERLKRVANGEFISARIEGKQVRAGLTATIQSFVEYAEVQGSENSERYYMVISKMVNSELLILEGKAPQNLRDILTSRQLRTLSVAEDVITKALIETMSKGLPYKEAYQIAKQKVAQLAVLVGKSAPGLPSQSVGRIA